MPPKLKRRPPVARSSILPTEPSTVLQSLKDHIMLFYGPPGVGKTSFVHSLADRVLFISTDRGSRFLNAYRAECTTLDEVMTAISEAQQLSEPFDLVCIDHVDDVARWVESDVCEALGIEALSDADWGKGWSAFNKKMTSVITELKKIDSGLAFIAHESIKTVRMHGIEKEIIMPEMSKRVSKTIIPICDLVGYCGMKRVKDKTSNSMHDIRILQTILDGSIYAKDRTLRRKPKSYELLDGAAFVATFEQ